EDVREEQDLAILRNRLDHRAGVARGAAVIRQRLHLGRGVDVADDDRVGVFGLPTRQRLRVNARSQRAPGLEIGNQHGAVGREDGGRLGHEVHAGEHDHVRVRGGSLLREPERVADVVRDVLHLGHLVVVGQDHGVSLLSQRPHLVLQAYDLVVGQHADGVTSMAMSRARTEWVSAPTEMASTPVSATSRTVSIVMPPDASSRARPFVIRTAWRSISGCMLSSRTISARAASASSSWASVSASTSTGRPGCSLRSSSTAAVTDPATARWLSLISTASSSPRRWLVPPPHATAALSSSRSPGAVLRVSSTSTPVPRTASTYWCVAVAIPDIRCNRFSAVRSAVSSARSEAWNRATVSGTRSTQVPSPASSSMVAWASSRRTVANAVSSPHTTPRSRTTTAAAPRSAAGTMASVVRSPAPISSA